MQQITNLSRSFSGENTLFDLFCITSIVSYAILLALYSRNLPKLKKNYKFQLSKNKKLIILEGLVNLVMCLYCLTVSYFLIFKGLFSNASIQVPFFNFKLTVFNLKILYGFYTFAFAFILFMFWIAEKRNINNIFTGKEDKDLSELLNSNREGDNQENRSNAPISIGEAVRDLKTKDDMSGHSVAFDLQEGIPGNSNSEDLGNRTPAQVEEKQKGILGNSKN